MDIHWVDAARVAHSHGQQNRVRWCVWSANWTTKRLLFRRICATHNSSWGPQRLATRRHGTCPGHAPGVAQVVEHKLEQREAELQEAGDMWMSARVHSPALEIVNINCTIYINTFTSAISFTPIMFGRPHCLNLKMISKLPAIACLWITAWTCRWMRWEGGTWPGECSESVDGVSFAEWWPSMW